MRGDKKLGIVVNEIVDPAQKGKLARRAA